MKRGLRQYSRWLVPVLGVGITFLALRSSFVHRVKAADDDKNEAVAANAVQLVNHGRQIFRFDTFGDQAFWGGMLGLHQAIEGAALGGVGPGVSPITALSVGLKVDVDALPANLIEQIKQGQVSPGFLIHPVHFNQSVSSAHCAIPL